MHVKKMCATASILLLISLTIIVWQKDILHMKHCHKDNCLKGTITIVAENIWNSLKLNNDSDGIRQILSFFAVLLTLGISFDLLKRTPVLMKSRMDI